MQHPFYNSPSFEQPHMQNVQNGSNFMQQLSEFSQMLQGNPEAIARNLLNSGKMSQQQFNQYAMIANQITGRSPF